MTDPIRFRWNFNPYEFDQDDKPQSLFQFAWVEDDGTTRDGEWKKHLIEQDAPETRTMRAANLKGSPDHFEPTLVRDQTA